MRGWRLCSPRLTASPLRIETNRESPWPRPPESPPTSAPPRVPGRGTGARGAVFFVKGSRFGALNPLISVETKRQRNASLALQRAQERH